MAKKSTAKKTTKKSTKKKTNTPAKKPAKTKATKKTTTKIAAELELANPIVEVDQRTGEDRRQDIEPVAGDRRKVQRRRQIDPTTCERDYTDDEIAFMQAMDEYKQKSGRMFPTCSEILEVVRSMGYERVNQPTPTTEFAGTTSSTDAAGLGVTAESELPV